MEDIRQSIVCFCWNSGVRCDTFRSQLGARTGFRRISRRDAGGYVSQYTAYQQGGTHGSFCDRGRWLFCAGASSVFSFFFTVDTSTVLVAVAFGVLTPGAGRPFDSFTGMEGRGNLGNRVSALRSDQRAAFIRGHLLCFVRRSLDLNGGSTFICRVRSAVSTFTVSSKKDSQAVRVCIDPVVLQRSSGLCPAFTILAITK